MQHSHGTFGTGLLIKLMSAPGLFATTPAIQHVRSRITTLAALAADSPMPAVTVDRFLIGTSRSNSAPFSLDLQYDDVREMIFIVAPVPGRAHRRSHYGLFHMCGNAAEWVEDWFGIDYDMTMPDHNLHGPANGRCKIVRGESWKIPPALLRTATRSGALPDQRARRSGFAVHGPHNGCLCNPHES